MMRLLRAFFNKMFFGIVSLGTGLGVFVDAHGQQGAGGFVGRVAGQLLVVAGVVLLIRHYVPKRQRGDAA